jgi:hypothetical protein
MTVGNFGAINDFFRSDSLVETEKLFYHLILPIGFLLPPSPEWVRLIGGSILQVGVRSKNHLTLMGIPLLKRGCWSCLFTTRNLT